MIINDILGLEIDLSNGKTKINVYATDEK